MTDAPSPIFANARAARLILDHAEHIGLPAPISVTASSFEKQLHITVATLDDLTDWARWLEVVISHDRPDLFIANGTALEHPVRVIAPAAVPARAN